MRKTDINQCKGAPSDDRHDDQMPQKEDRFATLKAVGKVSLKVLLTILMIGLLTAGIVMSSIFAYAVSLSGDTLDYDLRAAKLQLTSFIYVNDSEGNPQEYQRVYNTENRVWVDFDQIPDAMKNAVIAIEDKRFLEHQGVDWVRTAGAVLSLATGSDSYGGSTLTQQLIKNLTEDNEVSLTRKLREIFRALNFEKKYSKDEILEAYLNVVNFGSGSRGVQAAANLYFGKDIKDCSIAECAAIAGITQNPAAYTPLIYPENNKERRETVLGEMYEQDMITLEEYNAAMTESANMQFAGSSNDGEEDEDSQAPVRNWYIEAMFSDIINDLSEELNIGKTAAEEMLLTQGLKIYCAMDQNAQTIAETVIRDESIMPSDQTLDLGYVMMDFDGRILATLGCRAEKTGDLWFDKANTARRQPGSVIKPIALYAPAIDLGMYHYSSLIPDEPLKNVDVTGKGDYKDWPDNWYGGYKGNVTLEWALEKSANAPAAQVLVALTPKKSYNFLTEKLGFKSLDPRDGESLSPLATGGTHIGVTVREMTAAFQIFGNGGQYHEPYTYFYVLDKDDNIILDNREKVPTQAVSSKTATVMNRLLRNVIVGPEGTGTNASISGWNVIGKTGTTTDDYDSWFVGETPYAVAGIWTGYDTPKRIYNTGAAINIWRNIMTRYLKDKEVKDYHYDSSVIARTYCKETGKLANSSYCGTTATGYYAPENVPPECNGNHQSAIVSQNPPDRSSVSTSQASESISSSSAVNSVPSVASSEPTSSSSSSVPSVSSRPEETVLQ